MTGKNCAKKHKGHENAMTVKRKPSSEELFNVGHQPSIPTRGLSSILTADEVPVKKLRGKVGTDFDSVRGGFL